MGPAMVGVDRSEFFNHPLETPEVVVVVGPTMVGVYRSELCTHVVGLDRKGGKMVV